MEENYTAEVVGITFSKHARERSHQRSVPPAVVDLLMSFGKVTRSWHADRYSVDRRARRRIKEYVGPEVYRQIEHKLNCYAVIGDDGSVITVARRRRMFRHQ